jgi:DNA polymerase (family 10)
MERIMMVAVKRGCFLELNGQPERLDLNDTYCKLAEDMRLKLAISTDAHTTTSLDYIRYGVDQARRGWLEPDDVINTRSWSELQKLLKRSGREQGDRGVAGIGGGVAEDIEHRL